ncbi:hypothetical protein ACOMHN_020670 [Nucella lapillus]
MRNDPPQGRPLPLPPSQIPVSQARLRRRQQHSQTETRRANSRGQIRSHTNISQYRPDYVWNRGGRVKELRVRNLARKYLYLWIRNVFGRVLPSRARAHYHEALVGRSFALWHVYWWELRQEWRLTVRAECHYRYMMWLKVFGAWKDFIILRTVKNAKIERATELYSRRLSSKVLQGWKTYLRERRRKKALCRRAGSFHASKMIRHVWLTWKESLEQKHVLMSMNDAALQFWAFRIQAQHWQVWCSALKQRQAEQRHLAWAAQYRGRVLEGHCLRAWLMYWRSRRSKKQYRDYSCRVHAASLKLRVFAHWYHQWRVRRAVAQHQEHMTQLAVRFQTRRFFCRWHTLWQDRLEEREEEQQYLQTVKARSHYRQALLTKLLQQMLLYKQWRDRRKAQYVKADTHYYLHMAPYCLFRMKVFVQMRKTHRHNKEKAEEFRRESVLTAALSTWSQAYTHSKDVRLMARMAILHREHVMVHSFFHRWRAALTVAVQQKESEAEADEHYRSTLCRSHILAWRDYVRELRKGAEDEVTCRRHHYLAVLKRSVSAWRQYVSHQRRKHTLQTRAQRHLCHKVYRRSMVAWKTYVNTSKAVSAAANLKYHAKCQQALRWAFESWRENSQREKEDRRYDQAAAVHFNRQLLTKVLQTWRRYAAVHAYKNAFTNSVCLQVLQTWRRYAAVHAYKKSQTQGLVEETREQLRLCTLRIYLECWQKAKDRALVQRLKEERATIHCQHNLLTGVIRKWQLFHSHAIRKQLLRRQSESFQSVMLTARYYLLWKKRLAEWTEERERSGLALWHWSLVLQRKVLQAWFLHKEVSQLKMQRTARAMERRRARLVKQGASQWIKVAAALTESRMNRATQQQLESASSTLLRARRCAVHWKLWAAKRALTRLHLSSQPPSSLTAQPLPATIQWVEDLGRRARPKPRHPAFLMESLQRAGLLADAAQCVDPYTQSFTTTDTEDDHEGQQHPDGGRYGMDRVKPSAANAQNILSCEVKTGSSSTLTGDHFVRPLRFSNSADTDSTVHVATTASSASPQYVTPTSQRSQPPGNPLLQSSPISIHGLIEEALQAGLVNDSDKVSGEEGFRSSDGEILGGNLTHPTSNDTPPVSSAQLTGVPSQNPQLILMKPEDFMKKRDGTDFPPEVQRIHDPSHYRETAAKPAPCIPRSPRKSGGGGSARDREGEKLQGILLVKGADSDTDVSPLNTARSRGTVTFASPKTPSPTEELRSIRDRLLHFKEQKKKLRHVERQQKQLSTWLQQQSDPSDPDASQVTEELNSTDMEGKRLLTVIFIVAAFSLAVAEKCIKISECVCKTQSGKVVDLNPLSESSHSPRFTAKKPGGPTFYFNPCKRLKQAGCNKALGADIAVCQEVPGTPSYYDAGDFASQTFSGDPSIQNLSLVYSSKDSSGIIRTSYVALICSEVERLEFENESPERTYHFKLYQNIVCVKSGASGLGTGYILFILFFVFIIVYWVGGILYMKFVRRAEGLEIIPNYEFWKELPLLIQDGVLFTLRGCKGESTYEKI